MSSEAADSNSESNSGANTPTRRKHFTVHLSGKIRKAFHHTTNENKLDQDDKKLSKNKKYTKSLRPPELTLNDAKIGLSSKESSATEGISEGSSPSENTAPLLNLPFTKSKLKARNRAKKDNNYLDSHFLSVEGASGTQRKRSRSINIDDRLNRLSNQFLDPRNYSRSKESLHKTLSLVRSNQGQSHDEIRSFLTNHKQSPLKKFFFTTLLEGHRCEELINTSSKVIILDSKLPISKAFLALFHNNLRAAPVWNSESLNYDGMMTVTDFIEALLNRHQMALDVNFEKFSKIKIGNLKKVGRFFF